MKDMNSIVLKSLNPQWLSKQELSLNGFKFNEKKNLVQLTLVVTKDDYKYEKEGNTNLYEKFSVYATNIKQGQMVNLKLGKKVKLDKVEDVKTFGDYNTSLSITGEVQFYD